MSEEKNTEPTRVEYVPLSELVPRTEPISEHLRVRLWAEAYHAVLGGLCAAIYQLPGESSFIELEAIAADSARRAWGPRPLLVAPVQSPRG